MSKKLETDNHVCYFSKDEVLMHKWRPSHVASMDTTYQNCCSKQLLRESDEIGSFYSVGRPFGDEKHTIES